MPYYAGCKKTARNNKGSMVSMLQGMSERGTSLVEFALVLPLLLIITFGIIEFSVMLYDQQVITNAAREGARRGIVRLTDIGAGVPVTDIETTVRNAAEPHLISFLATPTPPTIEVTCEGAAGGCPNIDSFGDDLAVRVTYNFQYLVIGNLVPGLGEGINLSSTATMKCE